MSRVACEGYSIRNPLIELLHAVPATGRIAVPVNFRLRPDEVRYIVKHSGARVLYVDPELDESLQVNLVWSGPGKVEQWQLLTRARALDSTSAAGWLASPTSNVATPLGRTLPSKCEARTGELPTPSTRCTSVMLSPPASLGVWT